MSKTKVVHLRMDGKNYFFGSVKAMFDYIGEEKLGMSYRSFHSNVRLEEDETYRNRRKGYEVTVSHLLSIPRRRCAPHNGPKSAPSNVPPRRRPRRKAPCSSTCSNKLKRRQRKI